MIFRLAQASPQQKKFLDLILDKEVISGYNQEVTTPETPFTFIDFDKTVSDTLTLTAQFKDGNKQKTTINNPRSLKLVDLENGGLALYFDEHPDSNTLIIFHPSDGIASLSSCSYEANTVKFLYLFTLLVKMRRQKLKSGKFTTPLNKLYREAEEELKRSMNIPQRSAVIIDPKYVETVISELEASLTVINIQRKR